MTVDMLAATLFWPEGTSLHLGDDMDCGADDPSADQAVEPYPEPQGETFWAGLLRQIGWPLPPKRATQR